MQDKNDSLASPPKTTEDPNKSHQAADNSEIVAKGDVREQVGKTGDLSKDRRHAGRSATPSPATEKVSGAGPALAERSKDAKAPSPGRQPGAYVKR
jgi:hypothetical protein